MKKHENGQGLVEYALILVLIAIVVIAMDLLLGPVDNYCQASYDPSTNDFYVHEVSMEINDESLIINVIDTIGPGCKALARSWEVSTAHYGTVENHNDGTFTYTRYVKFGDKDDSFTYNLTFNEEGRRYTRDGTVNIIVGEPDSVMSVASSTDSFLLEGIAEQDLDNLQEHLEALYVAESEQVENIREGLDLNIEAVEEGAEALIDYALDIQNQLLYENLSQFMQAIEDGNWNDTPVIFSSIALELEYAPIDVYVDMNMKMAPRLIAACEVVSDGTVSTELIDAALQVVEELDDSYPEKMETLQLIQDMKEVIEVRNFYIQEHTSFQSARLDKIIELLETAEEFEMAEQLAIESEACSE